MPSSVARANVRVRKRVRKGLAKQVALSPAGTSSAAPRSPQAAPSRADILVSLPRRKQSRMVAASEAAAPPMKVAVVPKVSRSLFYRRLLAWLWLLARYATGTVRDRLRRRDTPERRAVRLRGLIEEAGGTLIRIGQHMALRLDLLPVRLCEELALMHDHMLAFPIPLAIAAVERETGKPLAATFARFDPLPIDSTSLGCVYQAVLRETGAKVAVKVRRPGIDAAFEADLQVLEFLVSYAETLTLIDPRSGAGFTTGLRHALADEMDFRRGARHAELFGRRVRKAGMRFCRNPHIYTELSTSEVLVSGFASGMWLWEVLATLETNDPAGRALMRRLNIDPRKVVRRLLRMHLWSIYEHLTFHADPHQDNIVVRANSRIAFTDWGVNGFIIKPRRELFRRFQSAQLREDPWGMAQATITLFEPLPARDLNKLAKEIEWAYYEQLLVLKGGNTQWHERSSAAMWLAALRVMRAHNLHAPADLLLYVRATLMFDTLAARLWPKVNYQKAFKSYADDFHERRRQRGMRQVRRRLRNGPLLDSDFGTLSQLATSAGDALFRLQRIFSAPYDFAVLPHTIEKWAYTFSTVVSFLVRSVLAALVVMAFMLAVQAASGQPLDTERTAVQTLVSPLTFAIVALLALLHARIILFRLADHKAED
jgi:ubiquinone biosynthesis protein